MEKEALGNGKWLWLVRSGRWEWVERHNVTGVVALYAFTEDDEVVLVEQPRPPLGSAPVLEIPAGLVGDIPGQEDEALVRAAQRELIEETGFESQDLQEIVQIPTCAGMTSETTHLYIARGLKKVGPGGGDDSEDITVHLVPMSSFQSYLQDRIAAGAWIDPKVFGIPFFAAL